MRREREGCVENDDQQGFPAVIARGKIVGHEEYGTAGFTSKTNTGM